MSLCRCGHRAHPYMCMIPDCKCERFQEAQCECDGTACGGYGKRHNGLSRCFNNAVERVTVAVPVQAVNSPFTETVDQVRLYCYPCARRHERRHELTEHDDGPVPFHGGSDEE